MGTLMVVLITTKSGRPVTSDNSIGTYTASAGGISKSIADCLNFAITFTGHVKFLTRITRDRKK